MIPAISTYLQGLSSERRDALMAVREVIQRRLPEGFVEAFQHGMLSWVVPLERYPRTYNGEPLPIVSLAAQKRHLALYLVSVYGDDALRARLEAGFRDAHKRLDMGKSCLRFQRAEDLPLDVIGDILAAVDVETLLARDRAVHARKK